MNKHKSLLDSLKGKGIESTDDIEKLTPEKLDELTHEILPEICLECNNQLICNVFQTIANISTLGIYLEIRDCRYYAEDEE